MNRISVAPDTFRAGVRQHQFSFEGPVFLPVPSGTYHRAPGVPFTRPVPSGECTILRTDVAGFGDPRRDDDDRRVVRRVLYGTVRAAFESAGVPWAGCRHEDRGDGILTVVPPGVATTRLVDPLLPLLADGLRRHNRRCREAVRVRLRAALHTGRVCADDNGLTGDALIHAARMLDARILKKTLREHDADLAIIVSGRVYHTVLRHLSGPFTSAAFRPVRFTVKESRISAWLYAPEAVGRLVAA